MIFMSAPLAWRNANFSSELKANSSQDNSRPWAAAQADARVWASVKPPFWWNKSSRIDAVKSGPNPR